MRSSERARDLGEVFTPESTVNEMLDLLQDVNYASKFLEPGCGSGNFLVEILGRKLDMVERLPEVVSSLKTGRLAEYEFKCAIALASIYAVDIDPLNVAEASERLFELFEARYFKATKQKLADSYAITIKYILKSNVILGDLVNNPEKITVVEYSELPGQRVKQRIFRFSDLIFPEDEVFEDNNLLFGHVPVAISEMALIHYSEIGNSDAN